MPISRSGKKLLVITSGDPAGIGPEIILKLLQRRKLTRKFIPLVIGDWKVFLKVARTLKTDISSIKPHTCQSFDLDEKRTNFLDLDNVNLRNFKFGKVNAAYGRAAMEYLSCGTSLVKSNKSSALVTAPISKEAINKAGFKFAGHTEFLARATKSKKVTMMLAGGPLKVSLVTRHIPLKDVPGSLTRDKIIYTAKNTHYALRKIFKIKNPKIGIAALNPHAGEGGVLGKEERSIIRPAVELLRKKIKGITGPHPADTLFYKAYKGELDAVVSMYHDEGLIPLKMIAFDKGVNITIGLPFMRTSPDHGTAFDIAGKGKADPSSMIEAVKVAISC